MGPDRDGGGGGDVGRIDAWRVIGGDAPHQLGLGGGHSQELILRRYLRAEQLADDPGVAAHEAMVLELIADMATPTPRFVGCDPTGERA